MSRAAGNRCIREPENLSDPHEAAGTVRQASSKPERRLRSQRQSAAGSDRPNASALFDAG